MFEFGVGWAFSYEQFDVIKYSSCCVVKHGDQQVNGSGSCSVVNLPASLCTLFFVKWSKLLT